MKTTIDVRLPSLPTVPAEWRGKPYRVSTLLQEGSSNPKLAKSEQGFRGATWQTWGLSLAPAHESGYQMCPGSTAGCRAVCLYRQGRGQCPSIAAARIARTVAFMEQRDAFLGLLLGELKLRSRIAIERGLRTAVRLNVLSDVAWETVCPEAFRLPGIDFYDYTKLTKRMLRFLRGKFPGCYHLTFSRSETNAQHCRSILLMGGNVAVVMEDSQAVTEIEGYPVIDGDEDDLRFLDKGPAIIALRTKGSARHDTTGFVAKPSGRISLPVYFL